MLDSFLLIENNLGIGIESLILLGGMFVSWFFAVRSASLGFIFMFFISSLCALWFWVAGWDYSQALIASLVSLGIMSVSLYYQSQQQVFGGMT